MVAEDGQRVGRGPVDRLVHGAGELAFELRHELSRGFGGEALVGVAEGLLHQLRLVQGRGDAGFVVVDRDVAGLPQVAIEPVDAAELEVVVESGAHQAGQGRADLRAMRRGRRGEEGDEPG